MLLVVMSCYIHVPPAPSAPPNNVRVLAVTFSSITVQWEMVPCIDRNGDITGYSVQYLGGGASDIVPVTGGGATMTTITGLSSSTDYFIQVAAINSAGTGVYSDIVTQHTDGKVHIHIMPPPYTHTLLLTRCVVSDINCLFISHNSDHLMDTGGWCGGGELYHLLHHH